MLTHQTTGFRPQLEDGQARGIVHEDRGVVKLLDLKIQLFPLVALQASALDLLTRNLTNISDKTVDQLDITHFEREQRYRIPIINSNILGHGKYESRLTHSRTGSYNNKVGILPAGSHLVELMETTRQTTQAVGSCRCFLKHLIRFLDDRINLRIVFLHVLLRDFEEFSFGFLHQIVYILSLVERLCLDVAGKRNQARVPETFGR